MGFINTLEFLSLGAILLVGGGFLIVGFVCTAVFGFFSLFSIGEFNIYGCMVLNIAWIAVLSIMASDGMDDFRNSFMGFILLAIANWLITWGIYYGLPIITTAMDGFSRNAV